MERGNMRFTWLSNSPWSNSGYGQQSGLFVPRIASLGHDMAYICYFGLEGGMITYGGIPCYPKRIHPYGNDICVNHTQSHGADAMISLMDVWVMEPEGYPFGFKWIAWYPVDHDEMPLAVRRKVAQAFCRIAMTKHGVNATLNAGLDCSYVPHGIDTKNIFYPRDKAECRKELELPEDAWIVGTVAMNKGQYSRKNFVEMMTAFANFKKRHTNAFYFLQTDRGETGGDVVNLPEIALSLGLEEGKDFGFCHPYQNILGYPPEYFAKLYSSFDVHLLVSAGEGFGIPTIEAQACGTPVIVGDWTASGELCFSGKKVDKKDAAKFWTGVGGYQFRPYIRAIELAMESEYKRPSPTDKTVKIIQDEYDADVVLEKHWKPVLAEIAEVLECEK